MALDKEKQEELEQFFTKKLQEQYRRGLAVGVKAACKAVLDMLHDSSKPLMKRIDAVKTFCKTPFGMSTEIKDNKTEEKVDEAVEVAETEEKTENTDGASE